VRGKFITFEGIDGAGKSTHIEHVAASLRARGLEVILTREPGGTPLGEKLRELLLSQPMDLETETLLMFAARREHVAKVIEPALARGAWVVSDRFTDATRAYQGAGRGVSMEKIEELARWTHPVTNPDLTFVFDLPAEVAAQRLSASRDLDRFEQEQAAFHMRVREGYLQLVRCEPLRFRLIDSSQAIPAIKVLLDNILSTI
jgi:dTMP kinase